MSQATPSSQPDAPETPEVPEAAPPAPKRQRFWVVYTLIILCVLVECVLFAGDVGWLPVPRLRQTVYEYAGFWPGLFGPVSEFLGPWPSNYAMQPVLMFFSYTFLHGGLLHLLFNMVTLVSLGKAVTIRVRQRGFVLIFASAVIGGGFGYGLLANSPTPMVGASGGLFGLAGALLSWNYVDRFLQSERLIPVLQAILGLLLFNLVLWWLMDGHLAWETHLGGFVAGWIAALLVDPSGRKRD